MAVFHSAGALLQSSISLKKKKKKKAGSFPSAPAMLVLVQFLLGQVGSPQRWRRSAVQAGKQLRGMPNGFSIPPCGSTLGQRRELCCGRRQLRPRGLPGTGAGGQRGGCTTPPQTSAPSAVIGAWRLV